MEVQVLCQHTTYYPGRALQGKSTCNQQFRLLLIMDGGGGGYRGTECTSQRVGKNRRCQQNGKRDVS